MPLCHIALGANLGDPKRTFRGAIKLLDRRAGSIVAISSFYKTSPLNAPGRKVTQPEYLNAVVALDTDLSPLRLLEIVSDIEVELGLNRTTKEVWGPRMIDLDIVSYAEIVLYSEQLSIPHLRMHERDFVLLPLVEIAPAWIHPTLNRSAAQLLNALLRSDAELFVRSKAELRSELEAELINLDSTIDESLLLTESGVGSPKPSFLRDPDPR